MFEDDRGTQLLEAEAQKATRAGDACSPPAFSARVYRRRSHWHWQ